jgi:hypothetical protein
LSSNDLVNTFIFILCKGKKDNTYKFALARFLVDYATGLDESDCNRNVVISFETIAESFLKYYWHQVCKYRIRQNPNPNKLPLIVKIIYNIFGSKPISKGLEDQDAEKIPEAEKRITRDCFKEVIHRFHKVGTGNIDTDQVFYEYGNVYNNKARNHGFLTKERSDVIKSCIS